MKDTVLGTKSIATIDLFFNTDNSDEMMEVTTEITNYIVKKYRKQIIDIDLEFSLVSQKEGEPQT